MIEKIKELLELFSEDTFKALMILNLVVSGIVLYKVTYNEATETFTRLIIDHNTKADLEAFKKQVCVKGIKSIIAKSVDKKFVDTVLANKLIDADYSNFRVEDTESISVQMRSDAVCIALLVYEDGEMRAFDIDMMEDREYAPLLYLVQDINETVVRERS